MRIHSVIVVGLAVLMLMVGTSLAQTEMTTDTMDMTMKGNLFFSGSMSYSSSDVETFNDRLNTWRLNPKGYLFVADNVAVGLQVGFERSSIGDVTASDHRYFGLVQYAFPMNGTFRPFVEGGGGFSRNNSEILNASETFNGWGLQASLGGHWFVTDNFAFTPAVTYIYEDLGEDTTAGTMMGTVNTVFVEIGVTGFMSR